MRSRTRYVAFALTAALALVGASAADPPNKRQASARAPGDGVGCSNGVQVLQEDDPRGGRAGYVQAPGDQGGKGFGFKGGKGKKGFGKGPGGPGGFGKGLTEDEVVERLMAYD